MKKTLIATLMFGGLCTASLPAQTAAPAVKEPEVAVRKERQQQRIANGVRSGELTPAETARLENKEKNINHETRTDRAANGGKLTSAEKRKINRQQNRVSASIYKDKHNAAEQQK